MFVRENKIPVGIFKTKQTNRIYKVRLHVTVRFRGVQLQYQVIISFFFFLMEFGDKMGKVRSRGEGFMAPSVRLFNFFFFSFQLTGSVLYAKPPSVKAV